MNIGDVLSFGQVESLPMLAVYEENHTKQLASSLAPALATIAAFQIIMQLLSISWLYQCLDGLKNIR